MVNSQNNKTSLPTLPVKNLEEIAPSQIENGVPSIRLKMNVWFTHYTGKTTVGNTWWQSKERQPIWPGSGWKQYKSKRQSVFVVRSVAQQTGSDDPSYAELV
jgi:hypothetical protein